MLAPTKLTTKILGYNTFYKQQMTVFMVLTRAHFFTAIYSTTLLPLKRISFIVRSEISTCIRQFLTMSASFRSSHLCDVALFESLLSTYLNIGETDFVDVFQYLTDLSRVLKHPGGPAPRRACARWLSEV